MPIIFQDATEKNFFRPKISDVSTFTFDLPIKWTRVATENRVGRVTVNRHIFFFGLMLIEMYVCGDIAKTPNYDGIIEISVCGAIILIPNYDSVFCIVEIYRYMHLPVLSW